MFVDRDSLAFFIFSKDKNWRHEIGNCVNIPGYIESNNQLVEKTKHVKQRKQVSKEMYIKLVTDENKKLGIKELVAKRGMY